MKRQLFLSRLVSLVFSRTAKLTYVVFMGNGLSAFFAFLFTVTYIRNFSFADVGYFSALWSLLLLVSDLADIGIGTSLSRFLPPMKETKQRLLSFLKTAFLLQLIIAVATFIILLLCSYQISLVLFHRGDYGYLVRITTVGILFTILSNFCQYALSAKQQFIKVGLLSAFSGLVRLILLVPLIIYSILNLNTLVTSQAVALLIWMSVSFILLKLDFVKIKTTQGDLKKLVSFAVFLGIARGLTAIAGRLDVLMLIALRNPVEAGIYATASRVISFFPMLSGSFSTVIAPKLAAISNKTSLREFTTKVVLATLGIIGIVLILIAVADPFMTILFSDKGKSAASVFQLLLISMVFFVGSIPVVSTAIYYLKKPHILTINSIIQLLIVIFGNFILIPSYGRFGAAISLILAYSITLLTTSIMCFYYLGRHHE